MVMHVHLLDGSWAGLLSRLLGPLRTCSRDLLLRELLHLVMLGRLSASAIVHIGLGWNALILLLGHVLMMRLITPKRA